MKKVIRLTERDLTKLIKRVINEQTRPPLDDDSKWDGTFPEGANLNDLKKNVEGKVISDAKKNDIFKIIKLSQAYKGMVHLFVKKINDVGDVLSEGILEYDCTSQYTKNDEFRYNVTHTYKISDYDDEIERPYKFFKSLANIISTYYCKRYKPKPVPPPPPPKQKVKIDYIGQQGQNQSPQV